MNLFAMTLGYLVMVSGGATIAIAIVWTSAEYWLSRWVGAAQVWEFIKWRNNKDRVRG